jgi:hypothetical protein
MIDRTWQVPQDEFVKAWNGATSLDEAAARVKELARGNVPRWAVMARALALRRRGVAMKPLTPTTAARKPDEAVRGL